MRYNCKRSADVYVLNIPFKSRYLHALIYFPDIFFGTVLLTFKLRRICVSMFEPNFCNGWTYVMHYRYQVTEAIHMQMWSNIGGTCAPFYFW